MLSSASPTTCSSSSGSAAPRRSRRSPGCAARPAFDLDVRVEQFRSSACASRRPMVDLPAPGGPISTARGVIRSPRVTCRDAVDVALEVRAGLGDRVATELVERGLGHDQRDHRLGHDAAAGTAHTSERWWIATASSPVAMSIVDNARGTVEIGFIAARTRRASPLVIPPSRPPARLVERRMPSGPGRISSCAALPRRRAVSKAVADLDALDRLDAHQGGGQLRVETIGAADERAEADGRPWTMTSTTPPRVSPSFFAASTRRSWSLPRPCRTRAPGWRRSPRGRRPPGDADVGLGRADRDDVREHLDAEELPEELAGDGTAATRAAVSRRGALEHRAGIVEAVLEHARVVGVARDADG